MELWRDVIDFEGYYQVSNLGRIKSLDRYVNGPHGKRLMKGKILSPVSDGNGRYQVVLCKESNKYKYKIHRIVAKCFLDNPFNLMEVNHIDGNPKNNCVQNLEWVDRKKNVTHAIENNLYPQGERHYKSFLTEEQILEIRRIYSEKNITQQQLAKKFGVSRSFIRDIVTHKTWKHIGGEKTIKNVGGEKDSSSKLTDKEVEEIKDLCRHKIFPQKTIGVIYGISQAQINRISNGKRRVK